MQKSFKKVCDLHSSCDICLKMFSFIEMKPEAVKVVSEVINAYKNSVCYKVGEALDAKRKEMEKSNSTFKKT